MVLSRWATPEIASVCRTEARQHGGMLQPIREPRFVELVVFAYVE
jgi:hypothetical protein